MATMITAMTAIHSAPWIGRESVKALSCSVSSVFRFTFFVLSTFCSATETEDDPVSCTANSVRSVARPSSCIFRIVPSGRYQVVRIYCFSEVIFDVLSRVLVAVAVLSFECVDALLCASETDSETL